MVNEQQIKNAALANASEIIKFKKEIERYKIYIIRIETRIDSLLEKIINIKQNIKENKTILKNDVKSYEDCDYEIDLASHSFMKEAKKHSNSISRKTNLDKTYIVEKHNHFFGRTCRIDEEILSKRDYMKDLNFDIELRDTQINNLKKLLKQNKHLLKIYRRYIYELNYRIELYNHKIEISTKKLSDFYLNFGNEECSKSKKLK